MKEISIVGLGVVGRVMALTALDKGFTVTLYDRDEIEDIQNTSYISGGMISAYSELDYCTSEVVEYQRDALTWWSKFSEFIDSNYKLQKTHVVSYHEDINEIELLKKRIAKFTNVELKSFSPKLSFSGFQISDEAFLDPKMFFKSSNDYFKNHKKCQFVKKEFDNEVELKGIVFDCRGMGAKDLSGLRGVRGEIIDVYTPDVQIENLTRLYHPRHPLYIIPRANNIFSLGATIIESEDEGPISTRSCLELLSSAVSYDEGFLEARVLNTFVGVRPSFKSSLPEIHKKKNIVSINGMYRNGFLFAPKIADKLLEEI